MPLSNEPPASAARPLRDKPKRPRFRLTFTVLLSALVTYGSWHWCTTAVAHQPLYELEWTEPVAFRQVNEVGPWLLVHERQQPQDNGVRLEVRTLADGRLVTSRHYPKGNAPAQTFHTVDHVELGKDCLVHITNEPGRSSLAVTQPRTLEQKIISGCPAGGFWMGSISPDGRLWLEQRQIPLAPFALLGTTGLPDVLAADFYTLLGHDSHELGLLSVPLVRTWDLTTGRLLGEFALPAVPGCLPSLSSTYDGKQFLEIQRPASAVIPKLLPQPRPTPDGTGSLRHLFAGLRFRDAATGRVLWDAPGSAVWLYPFTATRNGMVLRAYDDPSEDWPDWEKFGRVRPTLSFQLLLPQARRVVIVEGVKDGSSIKGPREGTVRLVNWEYQYDQTSNPSTQIAVGTTITLSDFDDAGRLLESRSTTYGAPYHGNMIPGADQVILKRHHAWPWQEKLNAWVERWPILRSLPLQGSFSGRVIDLSTGETHLRTISRQPVWVDARPTQDGRHLLVTREKDHSLQRLSVYALPFPPLTWAQRWLPAITAVVLGLGAVVFSWQLQDRRRRHQLA